MIFKELLREPVCIVFRDLGEWDRISLFYSAKNGVGSEKNFKESISTQPLLNNEGNSMISK